MPLLAPLAIACADPGAGEEDTDAQLDAFAEKFGDDKGDGFDLSSFDPCTALAPLAEFGDDLTHAGFFVGFGGEGALGLTTGTAGMDIVWDVHHQQLSVSQYAVAGVRTPGAQVGVEAYAGVAFGFEHGVSDWDGWFVNLEGEIGLPFLKDVASLQATLFTSGIDIDGDGVIAPHEAHVPPDGIYGFSVGAELSAAVPTGLPFEGAVTEGYWKPNHTAIRALYDQLRQVEVLYLDTLDVRLVDHHTGEACPEGWPEVGGDHGCVLQFGTEGESATGAAIDLAYSICELTTGCVEPLSLSMGVAAIGLGAVKDSGLDLRSYCE